MTELETLRLFSEEKRHECAIEAKAFTLWINKLVPANLVFVVGGALLALVAGTAMLVEQGLLAKTTAGILALISSAFTIVHSKLNCDQHQAECKRLRALYEGLSEDYSNLRIEDDVLEFKKRLHSLNAEMAQIKKSSSASPGMANIEKAKRLHGVNPSAR